MARATTARRQVSDPWRLAWALGAVVVAAVAGLLLTIIGLARRIAGQASDIEQAIDGARDHTAALFDLSAVNLSLDRLTRELRAARSPR